MKRDLTFLMFAICVFTSCKKEINEPLVTPTVQEEMVASESQIVCYQGIIKKDTVNLKLHFEEGQDVKGELAYLFFEKDRNNGTLVGQMSGDTLRGNYTFLSEGKESSREVVFLRKGKIIIEAYGDVEEIEKKTVFKDPKKLYFDSATVLTEVECAEPK